MRLLFPKPFRKNKLKIFKNFTLIDFFVFLALIAGAFLSVVFLPISGMWKIILVIPLIIPSIILILFNSKHDCRNYILILRWFKSKSYIKRFSKKPINETNNTISDEKAKKKHKKLNGYTDDLVAIEKIEFDEFNKISIVKSKSLKAGEFSYWTAFKVNGVDISNLNDQEKDNAYYSFSQILKFVNYRISFIKLSKLYELKDNEKYLNSKIEKLDDNLEQTIQTKEIYESYLNSLNKFKSSNYENSYYVVIYEKAKNDLINALKDLTARFEAEKFVTENLTKSEIIKMQLNIFNNWNQLNIEDKMFEDIIDPTSGDILSKALKIEDFLAFDDIKFNKSDISVDNDLKVNIQSISSFPLGIRFNWLNTLFETPSSVVMHINPVSFEDSRTQIHKSNLNLKTNAIDSQGNNLLDQIDLEKTQEALNELAERVVSGEEALKRFQIFFVNSAYSNDELEDLKKININNAQLINAIVNPLIFQQFEAFQNIIIKSTDNLNIFQECTDATLAGGWPFSKSDFNDKNGFIVGSTLDGNLVIFDQFKLDQTRTNYNMMILGSSGSGKSSFTKKLAMYHLAENNQNIIIDPESEYKGLLEKFGGYFKGSYYALGGDGKTKFNPLQIQYQLSDNDEEEQSLSNMTLIYNHVEWFGNWIKVLFPELDDASIRYIEQQLRLFYEKWFEKEIETENIATLDSEKFPTLTDFIDSVKKIKGSDSRKERILEIFEHNFINGKLSLIYNGYSNVDLKENLIIFDVQAIFNDESATSGRAALYIIISSINNQLIINYRKNQENKKKIILYIDEAHLLLDKDNPTTITFLHRTVKRIRKYNGGVVLTTQNPGDFADDGNSKKLTNILNNIQYSFLLKMKSQDVEAVSDLYKSQGGLTEYEKINLTRIARGTCLFNPSHAIRKFVEFHYNELEKQIAWANYINQKPIIEETVELESKNQTEEEFNVLLPQPFKSIYMFFYNLKHKNNRKEK